MTAEQKLPFHLYSRLRSIGVRFNRHGNCTTATVDTTVLGKFKAAYISRTTVELNTVHSYKENRIQQRVLRTFYGQWRQIQPLYIMITNQLLVTCNIKNSLLSFVLQATKAGEWGWNLAHIRNNETISSSVTHKWTWSPCPYWTSGHGIQSRERQVRGCAECCCSKANVKLTQTAWRTPVDFGGSVNCICDTPTDDDGHAQCMQYTYTQ